MTCHAQTLRSFCAVAHGAIPLARRTLVLHSDDIGANSCVTFGAMELPFQKMSACATSAFISARGPVRRIAFALPPAFVSGRLPLIQSHEFRSLKMAEVQNNSTGTVAEIQDVKDDKLVDETVSDDRWWTDKEETVARRKLDGRILPIIFILFGLSFLDRRSVAIFGLIRTVVEPSLTSIRKSQQYRQRSHRRPPDRRPLQR